MFIINHRSWFLCAFLFLSTTGTVDGAILIDGFSAATNDRFTNSPSFVANGFDLSGVGRRNDVAEDNSSWGTLIAPNAVLSANHRRAAGTILFYPDNDPTSTPVQRTVIPGGQRVGSTDLYISFLNANVPSSIKVYDFATETLTANRFANAGSFQGDEVFMVGRSSTASSSSATNQAVGRNRVTGFLDNVSFQDGNDVDTLFLRFDESTDPNFVSSEAWGRGGDSGAPLFTVDNGELLLLGVNSFQLTFENDAARYTGASYTGNVVSEINEILATNVSAIPEPSCFAFLTGVLVIAVKRRRSK